jgi:NADPH-dependent methylglyoxal reductase
MTKILVTGANGFLGAHVVKQALDNGYSVRGVVRTQEKAGPLKKLFPTDKFETVIVADLVSDYTEAVTGVDGIIHVASPFFLRDDLEPKKDMLDPAIEGTKNLLNAAHKAGVHRIVLTGGIGSILSKPNMLFEDTTYGPDEWLPFTYEQGASGKMPGAAVYFVSKKYAELAAWDFAKEHTEMKISVVIPSVIFGPIIHPVSSLQNLNTSSTIIYAFLAGKFPPDRVPVFCDVSSVALLHVKAFQSEAAVGKRIPFVKGSVTMYDVLEIIKKNRPELASRLPPTPDANPIAGKPIAKVDSSFAQETLGVPGQSLQETILQSVDALLKLEKELK